MPILRSILCALTVGLAGCATAPTPPSSAGAPALAKLDPAQARGHDFAVRRCSGCHTVGLDDGGAAEGPAFRALAMRYNTLSLEKRFAAVSAHGFDRMPPVSFTQSEARDLIAYLDSLHGN